MVKPFFIRFYWSLSFLFSTFSKFAPLVYCETWPPWNTWKEWTMWPTYKAWLAWNRWLKWNMWTVWNALLMNHGKYVNHVKHFSKAKYKTCKQLFILVKWVTAVKCYTLRGPDPPAPFVRQCQHLPDPRSALREPMSAFALHLPFLPCQPCQHMTYKLSLNKHK